MKYMNRKGMEFNYLVAMALGVLLLLVLTFIYFGIGNDMVSAIKGLFG